MEINLIKLIVSIIIIIVEICNTLLSRELKRNLFNLFASWSGQYAKPLGVISHSSSNVNNDEEKLQFSALQVCI